MLFRHGCFHYQVKSRLTEKTSQTARPHFYATPLRQSNGLSVDCGFVCTSARQTGPKKSSAQGMHKLSPTWPEARLENILINHVPFQIAPDFRLKMSPKSTVRAIVRFFASFFLSFTTFLHFTVRPGRGKLILASPRDDRRGTIFDVRDRFCDHLLSRKCVDWVRFAQGCRET